MYSGHSKCQSCRAETKSQDIELVINEGDQERAFTVLTSHGALLVVPEDAQTKRPATFGYWRELVNPRYSEFAEWMKAHLRGNADRGSLGRLRERHNTSGITP